MTPEPERVIEDGVAWVAFAYYEELLAERDALAARLAEAEDARAALGRAISTEGKQRVAAEARVAALTEALRDAGDGVLRACQLLPMTYSLAKPSDAKSHVEEAAIRLRQIVLPGIRAALAAADRPDEGGGMDTTPATHDALMEAWGIIANVSEGDWTKQPQEWQDAAVRWRELRQALLPSNCRVCDVQRASQLHHVLSKGQRGSDIRENLLPVCLTCHDLIHGRSSWALSQVRDRITENPAMLDYLVREKGWEWLNRAYPRWELAA